MTDLSPTAQAVLDEMYEVNMDFGEENANLAAAALRAAALYCKRDSAILHSLAYELDGYARWRRRPACCCALLQARQRHLAQPR